MCRNECAYVSLPVRPSSFSSTIAPTQERPCPPLPLTSSPCSSSSPLSKKTNVVTTVTSGRAGSLVVRCSPRRW
jgi:hypothetical protein